MASSILLPLSSGCGEMSTHPRYSEQGLSVRPAFFSRYNEVTIIVEDEGKENFYTEVFKRLFQESLSIVRVLCVGGKGKVLSRMVERAGPAATRIEFYVIDGDFDELIGNECLDGPSFYRLRRYDIESYLVEETAICTVAQEQSPSSSVAQYKGPLNIDAWVHSVVGASVSLAACAALLQELDDRQTDFSQAIERHTGSDPTLPDVSNIMGYLGRVACEQKTVESEKFSELLEAMLERIGISHTERIRWISGKHIFIPLVMRLIGSKTKSQLNKQSLCFRLAKHCEFPELVELRDRIMAFARPQD